MHVLFVVTYDVKGFEFEAGCGLWKPRWGRALVRGTVADIIIY